jgi:LPS export ABC transporter protein LptC
MQNNPENNTPVWLTLIMAAAAVVLLSGAILFYRHFFLHPAVIKKPLTPSSIITGADLLALTPQGQKDYHFTASLTYQYDKDNMRTFTQPHAQYYKPNQAPWQLKADHGVSLNNNQLIHLNGNVWLHQAAGKNNKAVTLTSSKMTVEPNNKLAYNKVLTHVQEPGLTVSAVGFHANLKTNVVHLLSQTHAEYDSTND